MRVMLQITDRLEQFGVGECINRTTAYTENGYDVILGVGFALRHSFSWFAAFSYCLFIYKKEWRSSMLRHS